MTGGILSGSPLCRPTFEPGLCCDPTFNELLGGPVDNCACPNTDLFAEQVTYPGYKDPTRSFPLGYCPG